MITQEFLHDCERYMQNNGLTYGAVFIPVTVPKHEMIDPSETKAYLQQNRGQLFVAQLLLLIDKSGKKDSDIYKKAGIDRRLFSKIRSNLAYTPAKKTIISLCMALELSREEADSLLSSAGYSLSRADDFDLAIAFCIEKQVYDLCSINEVLDHFGFEIF